MGIDIAQIQNAALKAAALEVDESGKKDGYIDASEINLFTDKATALLNEKKCTAQEFAALFTTNEVDKTSTGDVFAKVDSLHNAKNTPEALAKEAEEIKQAEKQEKIKEIKAEIAKNDKKLKLYEKRLAQKEISWKDYASECGTLFSKINRGAYITAGVGTFSKFASFHANKRVALVWGRVSLLITLGALVLGLGTSLYGTYKENKESSPKEQEKRRNEYKEAYIKVAQENEQLKAQLAELQK